MNEELISDFEKEISDLCEQNKELDEKLDKANSLIKELFECYKILFNELANNLSTETLLRIRKMLKEDDKE